MRNYISFRNNLLRHIEKKLKNIPFDEKVPYVKSHFDELFTSFEQSIHVQKSARPLFKQKAILEFRRLERKTLEQINADQEQIDLTNRMDIIRASDKEDVRKREARIVYLKTKYNPKVVKIDRDFIPDAYFENFPEMKLKIFRKDVHNDVTPDYKVERIHDGYYLTPIVEKEEKEPEGLLTVVPSRYYAQ